MAEIKNSEESEFEMEVMRDFSLRRTRARIVRLLDSNPDLKVFITLTFKENIQELGEANAIFKKFIKRLKRKQKDLKYLAVPEFQKRGAVHYHLLVNFEMRNDELSAIWDQGFVMINRVKHINNLGLYISKYVGKSLFDFRYFGMRKILSSRNLEKPLVIVIKEEIKNFFISNGEKLKTLFEKSYRSDWLGAIDYILYGQ
ncbi:MAG: rolling circle replication-associated protein [Patescibacteria group bacterium]